MKIHRQIDSGLGDAFLAYLKTDEAKAILSGRISEIIKKNGTIRVSVENMQAMQQELMRGYLEYVAGKEDVENQADQYMMEYLQTEGALQILAKWSNQIFRVEGDISYRLRNWKGWQKIWQMDIRDMRRQTGFRIRRRWTNILQNI